MINQQEILRNYFNEDPALDIQLFGNGLIHKTYILAKENIPSFILQQVNTNVFKWPHAIENNLQLLKAYLDESSVDLQLPLPVQNLTGALHTYVNNDVFRLIKYVEGSHAIDTCLQPEQAYEAAFQFGQFTSSFAGLDISKINATIPDFHNLTFRWKQFEQALANGNPSRIQFAKKEIKTIFDNHSIVTKYEQICSSDQFIQRVTHHDTKISNVLFDQKEKGICVIDLDTVMGGLHISDLGDMFRTYLSPGNEEETDLEKVFVRSSFYAAIVDGYLEKMADHLTDDEKAMIPFAGEFLIYMQALRFLTDYLNDDIYYGISYEMNNFNRTTNQLHLMESYRQAIK
jgi:Ser/Thr protein kinase RdoA (MazF antagonist)